MTNQFTDEQIKTAARKWIEQLDSDAHWARSPAAREKASSKKKILEGLLEAAAGAAPQAESVEHDHAGEAKLWCETHQHTHIAAIPRFTYLCKDCGWGQWYRDQAREHEYRTQENRLHAHETYEVEHVLVPLAAPAQPSSTVDEAALIREAKAEALEEFAGQMATGFNPQTLNAERRAIKREARTRAAEYREGSER